MRTACLILAALIASSAAHADDVISMISQYRRAHGLPAVHADSTLTALAQQQANAMAARGVLSHTIAGSFASRVANANVGHAGENIAMGQRSWADALRAWKASAGHNRNLLMPGATRIGVAVAHGGGARPRAYWAMLIAGGSDTRRARRLGADGKVVRTSVQGVPLMMGTQPRRGRSGKPAPRDFHTLKGEITGNE